MSTSTRNVAIALPAAAVITKKIIVAAGQREEDLEMQVESEANQYILFALEEVNLDFQVVGPAPSSRTRSRSLSRPHARSGWKTVSPLRKLPAPNRW